MKWLLAMLVSLANVPEPDQKLIRPVLEHPTLTREYAPRRLTGQVKHFEFLLDRLDLCSVLSERTGLLNYRAVAGADGRLYAENQEKASGSLALVGCEEGRRIFFAEGTQRGLFTVTGRGVVVVDYRQVSPTEMEYSGQLFVRVDNGVIAALAKLFLVFVKGSVDRNFKLVIAQPVALTELATGCPRPLAQYIRDIPEPDRTLVLPFAELMEQP